MITNWIKQSIAGETPEIDPSAPLEDRQMWRQFGGFVSRYQPQWIAQDLEMRSSEYGYTETVDWVARIGSAVVAGFVTAGASRPYPGHAIRLAAAAHADSVLKIDRCAILHIRPRFSRFIPVEYLDEWFKAFLGWNAAGRPELPSIASVISLMHECTQAGY